MAFAERYGPWALIAGASDGVGRRFAEVLAERGLNVVLVARRHASLAALETEIKDRFAVEVRCLPVDLSSPVAAQKVLEAVRDIDIGLFIYCAGGDANYQAFLDMPLSTAESMLQRNCTTSMQLSHALADGMVKRGHGGIIIIGSGAGFAGARNMVTYGGTKAFNMVFAEALWCELKPLGVDVLGLILGETDTPALRRLRFQRGLSKSTEEPVPGAETADYVVADALAHLHKGPTRLANRKMRLGLRFLFPLSRNVIVKLMAKGSEMVMGGNTNSQGKP